MSRKIFLSGLNDSNSRTGGSQEGEPSEPAQSTPLEAESEAEEKQTASDLGEEARTAGRERIKRVLESLIYVAEKPVAPTQLSKIVRRKPSEIRELLDELILEYKSRGIELIEVGGGYSFRSAASSAAYVREFLSSKPVRLTRAQLETLAIVAYRQPTTRPEIEDVRGVDTGSAIRVLLERGLIKMLGRKDEPGRPLLYGTTPYFLEFFGMRNLKDLPTLREFSDLTEESRDLFRRKTGESPGPSESPGEDSLAPEDNLAVDGDADELEAEYELEERMESEPERFEADRELRRDDIESADEEDALNGKSEEEEEEEAGESIAGEDALNRELDEDEEDEIDSITGEDVLDREPDEDEEEDFEDE